MPRAGRAVSLICAALCLALLVSSAGASAATPAWSPTSELPLPVNADAGSPDASLSRVACGSATSCTATGSYTDANGTGRALVASKTGGTWSSAHELDLPADASTTDPRADPTALACAAAGACALGGVYLDTSGQAAAMVATQSSGAWSPAARLQLPVANASPSVNALACGAPGSCSVVGSYETAAGTHAFIATQTGGVWSAATELDLPANADHPTPGALLHSVACGSDGSCAAVGSYKDGTGTYRAMVASQASGVWSPASELTLPVGASDAYLYTVACGAARSCTALGSYVDVSGGSRAMVSELTGGSWSSASQLALPSDARAPDPNAYVASVACGAAGACAAVGSYIDTSSTVRAMVVSQANGVWSAAMPLVVPADASPNASLNAVACGAPGSCAAAGSYVDAAGALRPMTAAQSGATWSSASSLELAANADPANPDAYVSSLACGAAASCTLAGRYAATSSGTRAMVASALPQAAPPPAQDPAPVATTTPTAATTPSKSSRPVVTLRTSRLRVAKRGVRVKLSCKAVPCSGTIKLTRISKGKTTVLATTTYAIGHNKSKTVTLRLTRRGKAAFRRAHTHSVKAMLVISVMGAKTTRKTVRVR
jgi:hypothetical protein